jgi:hypothetical protein
MKRKNIYEKMFNILENSFNRFKKTNNNGFEKGNLRHKIYDPLFHFGEAIWRKIQQLNLAIYYIDK